VNRFRTVAALSMAGVAGVLVSLRVVAPARFETLATTTRRALRVVPEPVVLGAGLIAGTLVWLIGMWLLGRLLYRVWVRIRGHVKWALGLVWPSSPLVQFAVGLMAIIGITFGAIAVLPVVANFGSADSGPASYADDLSRGDLDSVVSSDLVATAANCSDVDGSDRDDDGLPDRWERAGETPEGAQLPGADPGHKDLYVQISYGQAVPALNATERRQLQAVWERMSVQNPDGRPGIDIHLVTERLDERATFTSEADTTTYYTRESLGPRYCVYHGVAMGDVRLGTTLGVGTTPGYAAIVDGQRRSVYDGNVSLRVAVTTHELLHNVAGRVDGRGHTAEGWLTPGVDGDEEFLSAATRDELADDGLFGPVG